MSERGVGLVAANGSGIEHYGEKKIAGHTEDGEGVSLRTQRADARKVPGSVHKMNVGCSVVVLGGDESYAQNKEANNKTGSSTSRANTSCAFVCRCVLHHFQASIVLRPTDSTCQQPFQA